MSSYRFVTNQKHAKRPLLGSPRGDQRERQTRRRRVRSAASGGRFVSRAELRYHLGEHQIGSG